MDRLSLPDWPRLMPIELAAAYLSRSPTVIRERGPKPKRDGRSVLYDRRDLDRWADRLSEQMAKLRTRRTKVRTTVDTTPKPAHFRAAARWRSGYAEDCKSTDTPANPYIVRTIPVLFTPRFCVGFRHKCEPSPERGI